MARTIGRGVGVLAVVLASVVLLSAIVPGLSDLNPFATETRDRSQPVILRSLERLTEYRAATANLQVLVDVEEDTELLPSFLKGERTALVAAGNVDAAVDFRGIGERSLRVSDDRRAVSITLPSPQLTDARVDLARSRVLDRDRGLLDRIGSAFAEEPGDDRELLLLAERKLEDAARANSGLIPAAERNTRAMLQSMMRGLGFERVTVRFEPPQV